MFSHDTFWANLTLVKKKKSKFKGSYLKTSYVPWIKIASFSCNFSDIDLIFGTINNLLKIHFFKYNKNDLILVLSSLIFLFLRLLFDTFFSLFVFILETKKCLQKRQSSREANHSPLNVKISSDYLHCSVFQLFIKNKCTSLYMQ